MIDLIRKDQEFIWHPFTPLLGTNDPILISSAEGIYLHTADGRKIIDGISSWWVNLHGHSNPIIAKAISEQASKLEHVIFAGFTHEPAIQLAENLLSILPNHSKIFFSDNGSTAVEVAIKLAIQYREHEGLATKSIIALEGAYHGDTFGAMSVGERGLFTNPFHPYLFNVNFIPFPDKENEDLAITKFIEEHGEGIFIYEPLVQGASGMRMYRPEILHKLLEVANNFGITTIADEVFTGFGRTGKLFASNYVSLKPDIITLSKGITGGFMPLGATACNKKIVNAFLTADITKTFFHGHSYTANPIACAAANASFGILTEDRCLQQIELISNSHISFTKKIKDNKKVKSARCLGTIIAIELESHEATSYTNELRKKIASYFMVNNVLLRPLGNVIYILPPYVITKEELSSIYQLIIQFLDELNN
jgi:adenosylmethionine---8-amino-7-oxononanoate aminotransferase